MESNSILTFSCLSTLEQYIESTPTQKVRFHGASLHLSSMSSEQNAVNIDRVGLLKEYLQLAYHACACHSPFCANRKCSRMRTLIEHYESCDFTFHCQYYRSFYCLVVIHARECKELEYCRMPSCKSIRLSLQEKYIKQVIDSNLFVLNYDNFFERWSQGTQTSEDITMTTTTVVSSSKRKYDAIESTTAATDGLDDKVEQTTPAKAPTRTTDLYEMDEEMVKSRQEMASKRSNLIHKLKKWHDEHPINQANPPPSTSPYDRSRAGGQKLKIFPSVKTLIFQTVFEKLNMNSQKLLKELNFAKLTVRIMRKELEINRRVASLTEYANLMSEFIYENQKRIKMLRLANGPVSKTFADATTQTAAAADDQTSDETDEGPAPSTKRLRLDDIQQQT